MADAFFAQFTFGTKAKPIIVMPKKQLSESQEDDEIEIHDQEAPIKKQRIESSDAITNTFKKSFLSSPIKKKSFSRVKKTPSLSTAVAKKTVDNIESETESEKIGIFVNDENDVEEVARTVLKAKSDSGDDERGIRDSGGGKNMGSVITNAKSENLQPTAAQIEEKRQKIVSGLKTFRSTNPDATIESFHQFLLKLKNNLMLLKKTQSAFTSTSTMTAKDDKNLDEDVIVIEYEQEQETKEGPAKIISSTMSIIPSTAIETTMTISATTDTALGANEMPTEAANFVSPPKQKSIKTSPFFEKHEIDIKVTTPPKTKASTSRYKQIKLGVDEKSAKKSKEEVEGEEGAFGVLVATLLSVQTRDITAMRVAESFLQKFPDVESVNKASEDQIQELVRSCNYCKTKASNIKRVAAMLRSDFGGRVPLTLEGLMSLPGVGPKVARCVLSVMTEPSSVLVVDTHVHRISGLLGLRAEEDKAVLNVDSRTHASGFTALAGSG